MRHLHATVNGGRQSWRQRVLDISNDGRVLLSAPPMTGFDSRKTNAMVRTHSLKLRYTITVDTVRINAYKRMTLSEDLNFKYKINYIRRIAFWILTCIIMQSNTHASSTQPSCPLINRRRLFTMLNTQGSSVHYTSDLVQRSQLLLGSKPVDIGWITIAAADWLRACRYQVNYGLLLLFGSEPIVIGRTTACGHVSDPVWPGCRCRRCCSSKSMRVSGGSSNIDLLRSCRCDGDTMSDNKFKTNILSKVVHREWLVPGTA